MGVVQSIAPIVSLELVKLRQFKFRVLIDILLHQRMCLESRDLFNFWEISDNISLTVQDKDIVDMEH